MKSNKSYGRADLTPRPSVHCISGLYPKPESAPEQDVQLPRYCISVG
jgi:hypothetical protein